MGDYLGLNLIIFCIQKEMDQTYFMDDNSATDFDRESFPSGGYLTFIRCKSSTETKNGVFCCVQLISYSLLFILVQLVSELSDFALIAVVSIDLHAAQSHHTDTATDEKSCKEPE